MLFSSIPFLYYFLPIVILIYFAVPKCLKNTVLLLSSLFFYAWGEPIYVFLMVSSIAVNYFLGLLIEKFKDKKLSRFFLIISVVFSLGLLGYFKYADFFIENFVRLTGMSVPLLNIALPIGISFYTFQIISYTVDVYRGSVKSQKNPITLGAYISLFPQLIAGPIVRYSDVEKQLSSRSHSSDKAAEGIRRFIIGLSKKILLANTLGELCAVFHQGNDLSVLFYWLYAIAFMLQIYFDFSGYSDMAIGLGKILGFDFLENFNYPLISSSISEFWRRWHISLGSWFRDYVYFPLGGSRVKSRLRLGFNLFTVWLLTGIWHGANWTFVLWGSLHGIYQIVGAITKKPREKLYAKLHIKTDSMLFALWQRFWTFVLVCISWILFRANSISDVGVLLERLASPWGSLADTLIALDLNLVAILITVLSIVILSILDRIGADESIAETGTLSRQYTAGLTALVVAVAWCLLLSVGGASAFIYFQF